MPEQPPGERILLVRSRPGGDEVDAELLLAVDVAGRDVTAVDPDDADQALRPGGWDAVVLRWTGDRSLVYRAGGLTPRPGILAVVEQLPAAVLLPIFLAGVDDVVPLPLDPWEIERVLPQVVAVGYAARAELAARAQRLPGDIPAQDDEPKPTSVQRPHPVLGQTPVWPPVTPSGADSPPPTPSGADSRPTTPSGADSPPPSPEPTAAPAESEQVGSSDDRAAPDSLAGIFSRLREQTSERP